MKELLDKRKLRLIVMDRQRSLRGGGVV